MSGHVFISYSHRQDGGYAESLAAFLASAGLPVWFDKEIVTGDRWERVICSKIDTCAVFVVVMTPEADRSEWVAREIARARKKAKLILPLLLRGEEFFLLGDLQYEDVTDARMPSELFVARLRQLTNPQGDLKHSTSTEGERAAMDSPRSTSSVRRASTGLGRPRRHGPDVGLIRIYDSDEEASPFGSWSFFADRGVAAWKFRRSVDDSGAPALGFSSQQGEAVGLNKSLPTIRGAVEFSYKIDRPVGPTSCVYFAMIPMEETGPGRSGLIEVGGAVQSDPRNPRSLYRQRHFAPRSHYGDGKWHSYRLDFDFSSVERAFYVIFGPRINEGVDEPGSAIVWVSRIVALAPW